MDGGYHSVPAFSSKSAGIKILERHLLLDQWSDGAETWWEALWLHGDSELLKLFRSDIQDGCYDGHLEILQSTSPPNL